MKLVKGDRVRREKDTHIGTVTKIKERGVAGSAVTYTEWVEVTYDNGMVVYAEPRAFEKVDEMGS